VCLTRVAAFPLVRVFFLASFLYGAWNFHQARRAARAAAALPDPPLPRAAPPPPAVARRAPPGLLAQPMARAAAGAAGRREGALGAAGSGVAAGVIEREFGDGDEAQAESGKWRPQTALHHEVPSKE
jgi:hypothetical protein